MNYQNPFRQIYSASAIMYTSLHLHAYVFLLVDAIEILLLRLQDKPFIIIYHKLLKNLAK